MSWNVHFDGWSSDKDLFEECKSHSEDKKMSSDCKIDKQSEDKRISPDCKIDNIKIERKLENRSWGQTEKISFANIERPLNKTLENPYSFLNTFVSLTAVEEGGIRSSEIYCKPFSDLNFSNVDEEDEFLYGEDSNSLSEELKSTGKHLVKETEIISKWSDGDLNAKLNSKRESSSSIQDRCSSKIGTMLQKGERKKVSFAISKLPLGQPSSSLKTSAHQVSLTPAERKDPEITDLIAGANKVLKRIPSAKSKFQLLLKILKKRSLETDGLSSKKWLEKLDALITPENKLITESTVSNNKAESFEKENLDIKVELESENTARKQPIFTTKAFQKLLEDIKEFLKEIEDNGVFLGAAGYENNSNKCPRLKNPTYRNYRWHKSKCRKGFNKLADKSPCEFAPSFVSLPFDSKLDSSSDNSDEKRKNASKSSSKSLVEDKSKNINTVKVDSVLENLVKTEDTPSMPDDIPKNFSGVNKSKFHSDKQVLKKHALDKDDSSSKNCSEKLDTQKFPENKLIIKSTISNNNDKSSEKGKIDTKIQLNTEIISRTQPVLTTETLEKHDSNYRRHESHSQLSHERRNSPCDSSRRKSSDDHKYQSSYHCRSPDRDSKNKSRYEEYKKYKFDRNRRYSSSPSRKLREGSLGYQKDKASSASHHGDNFKNSYEGKYKKVSSKFVDKSPNYSYSKRRSKYESESSSSSDSDGYSRDKHRWYSRSSKRKSRKRNNEYLRHKTRSYDSYHRERSKSPHKDKNASSKYSRERSPSYSQERNSESKSSSESESGSSSDISYGTEEKQKQVSKPLSKISVKDQSKQRNIVKENVPQSHSTQINDYDHVPLPPPSTFADFPPISTFSYSNKIGEDLYTFGYNKEGLKPMATPVLYPPIRNATNSFLPSNVPYCSAFACSDNGIKQFTTQSKNTLTQMDVDNSNEYQCQGYPKLATEEADHVLGFNKEPIGASVSSQPSIISHSSNTSTISPSNVPSDPAFANSNICVERFDFYDLPSTLHPYTTPYANIHEQYVHRYSNPSDVMPAYPFLDSNDAHLFPYSDPNMPLSRLPFQN